MVGLGGSSGAVLVDISRLSDSSDVVDDVSDVAISSKKLHHTPAALLARSAKSSIRKRARLLFLMALLLVVSALAVLTLHRHSKQTAQFSDDVDASSFPTHAAKAKAKAIETAAKTEASSMATATLVAQPKVNTQAQSQPQASQKTTSSSNADVTRQQAAVIHQSLVNAWKKPEQNPPPPPPPPPQTPPPPQASQKTSSSSSSNADVTRQQAVVNAMRHAWDGYKKHAFGFDELRPLSQNGINNFGGLGATIIDSLDTLWIMGLKDEFRDARDWVASKFTVEDKGGVYISHFETTIRIIGGLLSAHDLSGDRVFVEKASKVASRLKPSFESTSSGLPRNLIRLDNGQPNIDNPYLVLADVGTEQLEFQALTDRSRDLSYGTIACKAENVLLDEMKDKPFLPIAIATDGTPHGSHISLGAMGDSYYEYLLKIFLMTRQDPSYTRHAESWVQSMDGMLNKLVATTPSGLTYVDENRNGAPGRSFHHLVCFVPGMLALGVMQLDNLDSWRRARYRDAAEKIGEFCYNLYAKQPSGLAPEYSTISNSPEVEVQPFEAKYVLRPETVESLFLLWRMTKDVKYRDWGWNIFQAIEKNCRHTVGYAGLLDVRLLNPQKDDAMQSFFLAETLKYMYLLFSDDDTIPLDTWVFNTEAHPIKMTKPLISGSCERL
ncbi:glycosyl hydrolase family 47 protein [Pseudoscourfieldia marina]